MSNHKKISLGIEKKNLFMSFVMPITITLIFGETDLWWLELNKNGEQKLEEDTKTNLVSTFNEFPVDDNLVSDNSIEGSKILSVPCVNGGGSGGWMYDGLPDHYFPLTLINVNEWPLRSIPDHPMYSPDAPWDAYGTCIITVNNNSIDGSTILSVPCVNGGGSGGWMYDVLPDHYFPLGLINVNEWPLRSIPDHPMYDPDAPWNTYGTCVIVPAKYP